MSHLLEQLEGRKRRAECEKHEAPWILPVSGPLSSADIAALRASHQRLKEALQRVSFVLSATPDDPGEPSFMAEVREALRSAP